MYSKILIYEMHYTLYTKTCTLELAKILSVNNNQFLRFENFNITNGPDLHVYLTNGIDIKSGMDLGSSRVILERKIISWVMLQINMIP